MSNVAIIGTAGRRDDGPKCTRALYVALLDEVQGTLAQVAPRPGELRLRSGGAAFADHIAVTLYLMGRADTLDLYLPAAWDTTRRQYVDTGVFDWRTNPGGTSNHYHRQFSARMGSGSSLAGIAEAIERGARVHVVPGFHNRNAPVGDVDYLIAATFGHGDAPKDGGTAHTWGISRARWKHHINLNALVAKENAS